MGTLSRKQIDEMGFAFVGEDTFLSDKASYYGCSRISIGNNTRVDDFCVLSAGVGGISIGNNAHIGIHSSLIGAGKIIISDFTSVSSHVAIYSSNDDYSGESMTGPTIPARFKKVEHDEVIIGRHVIIGARTIILPGVHIEDGVAIGCLSLVKVNCKSFRIYAGIPIRYISERKKDFLELEKVFLNGK